MQSGNNCINRKERKAAQPQAEKHVAMSWAAFETTEGDVRQTFPRWSVGPRVRSNFSSDSDPFRLPVLASWRPGDFALTRGTCQAPGQKANRSTNGHLPTRVVASALNPRRGNDLPRIRNETQRRQDAKTQRRQNGENYRHPGIKRNEPNGPTAGKSLRKAVELSQLVWLHAMRTQQARERLSFQDGDCGGVVLGMA